MARQFTLRTRILAGYAIPVALLLVLGVAMYLGVARSQGTIASVVHTYDVIDAARQLLRLMVDMETGERGFIITGNEEFLEPYQTAGQRFEELMARAKSLVSDNPLQVQKLDAINALRRRWIDEIAAVEIAARRKGDTGLKEATALMASGRGKSLIDEIRRMALDDFIAFEQKLLAERQQAQATADRRLQLTAVVGTLLAVVAALLAGVFVSSRVTSGVGEAVSSLASSSSEILAATAEQASSSAETAAAVNEASTTVEQARQTMELAIQKTRGVVDSSRKAVEISQSGQHAAEQSMATMDRGREQMASLAQTILLLNERNQSIGEIIASVNDLTEQSNVLAVNAAIEAAKAGEQGRGFGVVAAEIRSLADQARQATAQVRSILGEIQKATNAAVLAAEQGAKAVESAGTMSKQAGDAIRLLTEHTVDTAQAATQIAASSQQQSAGMDQIAQAMRSIQQATAQNVAGARQAERAAQDLVEIGGRLQLLVGADRHERTYHTAAPRGERA